MLGAVGLRLVLLNVPSAAILIPAGTGLAVLLVIAWGAGGFRRRWVQLAGALGVGVFLSAVVALTSTASAERLLGTADERIARIRKAPAVIKVVDAQGRPVAGAAVRVEQRRHAFLFGCNAFRMHYQQDALNAVYAARFSALFNSATLPFYWSIYEPAQGDTCAAAEKNQRLAAWCQANGIEPKGHPLLWHDLYPKWAPSEPDAAREALRERVTQIIPQFKATVRRWEVVNEATVAADFDTGLGHWVRRDGAAAVVETALRWAHEADPAAELVYNDFNLGRQHFRLIQQLVQDKAPLDIIGIQSHMHRHEWPLADVWAVCEDYARFGKPLHFTELTVLSGKHGWELSGAWPTTPRGEQAQADYVERLYKLLFSHPAVQAIHWWDLEDGAWQGAPGGLLRADLAPKPAYDRLLKLIRETWWTRESLKTDAQGDCGFSGFLGDYEVVARQGEAAQTNQFALGKGTNAWTVVLRAR